MNGTHILQPLADLGMEFRGVMRGLAHKPGYAIAAWVMLGLAIAANAAVFAIVYGFLLKPLPYANPGQLDIVRERVPKIGLNTPLVSAPTYLALKKGLNGIGDAGLSPAGASEDAVTISGQSSLLTSQPVTPSLFKTLGISPVLGRLPGEDAGRPGGPPEAVISWRFWHSAYGGSRGVLNQSFKVGGETYRIVGVMPRNFFVSSGLGSDAWLPFVMTRKRAQDDNINYWMVVRRRPGVSLHRLNLDLKNYLQRVLAKETPEKRAQLIRDGYTIDARSLHSAALNESGIGRMPWLLQAAAGLLLLLALANTINLGLVHQRARQNEFALRRVLGASRGGLVRLILLEHLPIACAIGVVAMLLTWAGIDALHAFGLPPPYSAFKVEMAPAVVVFTSLLTILATMAVAFGPALLATGKRLLETLGHGPTVVGGRAARHLQRSLGMIQVALACALVVAGGLLGVSLWRVLSQPIGFSPRHRAAITVILPNSVTSNTAAWATLNPELLKLPGVRGAALTSMIPFSGNHINGGVSKVGAKNNLIVNMPQVSAGYFATMRIPLLAGHGFTPQEIANRTPAVVINEALAKRFFGSAERAVGQSLSPTFNGKHVRVVGVARDVRWAPTPDQYHSGTAYLPTWAFPAGFRVVVWVRGQTGSMAAALKRTIQGAIPGSVVLSVTSLSTMVQGASTFRSAGAGMVGAFAALALLLAALGVFAITSFIARARLGEYGIRAALGASPLALLRLGFREAAWLLVIGLPIGLAGAYLLGRVIASALYRTPVLDPWLYIVGAVLIAMVVFAAAWGPAHRAARVPVRDLLGGGGTQ